LKENVKRILRRNLLLFSELENNSVQVFIYWLKAKRLYLRSPRIVKYALIHAGATFGTLSLMPPAGQLPGAVVLVVWAASFCVAYSLMAVFRL
jgi:hypothetical protein